MESDGACQTQRSPLIGKARRKIHESRDAIAARKSSRACRVDEGRVEEGERQRHADRARGAVLAGGEFGDVADRSFDEVLEPGPSARDAPDQPVPFVRLHGATERGRGAWFEKRPSHPRSRFDPGDR